MAARPIFLPSHDKHDLVETRMLEFEWFPGLSKSQKQKSVDALHESAIKNIDSIDHVLEISSKSRVQLGVALSAFNLTLSVPFYCKKLNLECAFQGSKVFERGGPFNDLFEKSPYDAKKDERLKVSGNLRCFMWGSYMWPLTPRTAFYDWLYINALDQNKELARELEHFDAFTDIEFNPQKSFSCQAYSAALYVSLRRRGLLDKALEDCQNFLEIVKERVQSSSTTSGQKSFSF